MAYDKLKNIIISSIDNSFLEKEALKLKQAVEEKEIVTFEIEGSVGVLVASGLLRYGGCLSGLHHNEYIYTPTERGLEIYKEIFNKPK